ncbi:MAG TPA: pitrilysin family protein, partial [Thermoanaerobaculia bacterium]
RREAGATQSDRWARVQSLVILLAFATPLLADDPFTAVHRETLPNGLQVWVKPRDTSNSVDIRVVVKVGFRHESVRDSGISHLLEHMLFTGTREHDEVELNRIIDAKGAISNAITGIESTHYFVQIIDRHFDFGLDWLREILRESLLAPDQLAQEIETVYSEQQGHYSPIIEKIFATGLFQPLEVRLADRYFPQLDIPERIIWSVDHIDAKRLREHFDRTYVPNNMAVIIVGKVDPRAAIEKVRAAFGDLQPRPVELADAIATPVPPALDGETRTHGFPPAGEMTRFMGGIWTAGRRDPDRFVFWVIREVLDRRLKEEVRYKRALARNVWARQEELADIGALLGEAQTKRNSEDERKTRALLRAAFRELSSRRLAEEELRQAKDAILGRMAIRYENNHAVGNLYQEIYLSAAADAPLPNYLERIESVTADDVLRVSRARFTARAMFFGVERPPLSYLQTIVLGTSFAIAMLAGLIYLLRRVRTKERKKSEGGS